MDDRDDRNQRNWRDRNRGDREARGSRQAEQFQDDNYMRGGNKDYGQGYRSDEQMGGSSARYDSEYDGDYGSSRGRGGQGNRGFRSFEGGNYESDRGYGSGGRSGGYGSTQSRYGEQRMRGFDEQDYRGQGQSRNGATYVRGDGRNEYQSGMRGDYRESHERHDEDRGFLDKVAGWFGAEGHEHDGREHHGGRGPSNYQRSDERVLEDACDRLTDDWAVDARNIQVTVDDSEVTLDGTVDSRSAKRRAEDCVHDVSGVKHVQNNLRVQQREDRKRDSDPNDFGTSAERSGKIA